MTSMKFVLTDLIKLTYLSRVRVIVIFLKYMYCCTFLRCIIKNDENFQ